MRRYVSADEDSARWARFAFRDGDIVISTRSKTGTTWLQMICLMLVLDSPQLPAPLDDLSPWLDHLVEPIDAVLERLVAQTHRRVIKTHTPLDGIPRDARATYLVIGRHPLDSAVSLYHQGDNIDRDRVRQLSGSGPAVTDGAPRPDLHPWLVQWTRSDADPRRAMDSLPGFMWHLCDAWERRNESNVLLLHYADLSADLDGQMRRLARALGISPSEGAWSQLVEAASFRSMRSNATSLAPARSGVLKDAGAFFRRGRSGAGTAVLSSDELAAYYLRTAELAPADLLDWLHRP